jgi:hypothetical protein
LACRLEDQTKLAIELGRQKSTAYVSGERQDANHSRREDDQRSVFAEHGDVRALSEAHRQRHIDVEVTSQSARVPELTGSSTNNLNLTAKL